MMAHLVLYTTIFPTPREPDLATFTTQLADALSAHYLVSVVRPVPWCPNLPGFRSLSQGRAYAGLPFSYDRGRVTVYHPRYFLAPKTPLILQSWLQFVAVGRFVRGLHLERRVDAINAHWIYPDGVAAVRIAESIGAPILLTALGSDINVSAEVPMRRGQISRALKASQGASGVSRALVARLIELGAPSNRAHYIPNGVNKVLFSPASKDDREALCHKLGLDPTRRYVIFVGRLHPVKGLRFLVEALCLLQQEDRLDFDTLLIGGGELEGTLKSAIKERRLEKSVRLVGNVSHATVPDWLRIGDAFCLPSLMEGMPNVVLEAMACGLPVVASNVGAIPDVVHSGSGLLVSPGDPTALAEALGRVMDRTWNRDKIAESDSTPDWHAVAAAYARVIDSIIAEKVLLSSSVAVG